MADNMEVIISAIDDASEIFSSIAASCEEMMSGITASADEASVSIDEIAPAAEEVESAISSIDPSGIDEVGSAASDAASGADELGDSLGGASDAADELGNSMGIIEGSLLLGAAEQIGNLAGNTEDMAQQMNTAAITIGQLATQTGIAEPQMVALINEISNATFPNDEAMMYVKSLSQIGVSASNLGKSATDLDKINDAFGMGAGRVNSLGQELSVLGVDMNNVSDSFNALAYANANTVGGMDNYYNFLRKYDAQFKDLGYDVDQSSIIIAAATQKYGGGRAALSGLSEALEEADGDTRKLEQALGIQAGTLDNASAVTGQYEGQLQELANEEAEHKTILDQIGAAWEDVSLSLSGVLSPAASAISAIGQVGSVGMSVKGIKELSTTFNQLRAANIASTASNYALAASQTVLNAATTISTTAMRILSGEISLVTIATEMWNAVLAMNPLVLVAVAAVALAVAVYEVGKAFGWWTDVSTMLDSIWAGVNRLWQAFINNPDVQAFLTAIGAAFNVVSGAVGNAVGWVSSFFNVSAPGNFDIVRLVIDAVGAAWNAMTLPIRAVITVIRTFLTIQELGRQAARGFINNVVNNIKKLPSQVKTFITRTAKNISDGARDWVKNARTKANDTVTAVTESISDLPGKVYTEFANIGGKIKSAVGSAVRAATSFGSDLKNAVLKALHIASPGIIQRKTVGEFEDTVTRIAGTARSAYNAGQSVGQSIVDGFDDVNLNNKSLNFNATGNIATDLANGKGFDITTGQYVVEDTNINLNIDGKLSHEFLNLTNNINEAELARIIEESELSDRFIYKLVNSDLFQHLDNKVKVRLQSRVKRNGA